MGARRRVRVTNQGQVEFFEDLASGQNRAALKAPATLAADYDMTLPAANAAGFLRNDGAGALSWNAGGATSLQEAYTGGRTINTTPGPVELQGTGGLDITADMWADEGMFAINPWIDVTHPDYGAVGDGVTNDTAAIVLAIAALDATLGGTLYFPRGTYLVDRNALIILKSRVTILGAAGAKLKSVSGTGNSHVVLQLGDGSATFTDIRVINLEIDGNYGTGGGNWQISAASQSHNIDIHEVTRCWIQNCYLHDSAGEGVRLNISTLGQVDTQIFITDNVIDTCARNGIGVSDGNHVLIARNQILNYNTGGIFVEPSPGDPANLTNTIIIAQNILKPSALRINAFNADREFGIALKKTDAGASPGTLAETCGRVLIVQNQIYGVTDAGVQYPDEGIYIQTWAGATVQGNFLFEVNSGIVVVNATGLNAVMVSVVGNHIRKVFGVGIQMGSQGACNANIVEYVETTGILVGGNDNTCMGNVVRNCGRNTYAAVLTAEELSGIRIIGGANIVVGNRAYDNQAAKTQTHGIAIDNVGTAIGNIVRENILTGNLTSGLLDTGASLTNKVSRNIGYVTENSGSSSVPNTATSVVVAHGLGHTPVAAQITITPTNDSTNDPVKWYVDTIGAANFTVHTDADPGASGWTFHWYVHPRS